MEYIDEFYIALGAAIRRARIKADITQEQLATKLHLNRTSITNIEKGKQRMLLHTYIEIANVLNIAPISLLPNISPSNAYVPTKKLVNIATTSKEKEFLRSVLSRARSKSK